MTRRATLTSLLFALALILVQGIAGTASAQSYRIQPGDSLRIEVLEDNTLNRVVQVAPDGRISLPLAGAVSVGGRTIEQVQADLTAKLGPNFAAAPTVFVALENVSPPLATGIAAAPVTIDVYVLGEIGTPGLLSVAPGTTVLQLFAQAKGFTRFAATKRIQLRRTTDGVERVYRLNYDAIAAGKSANGSASVMDGDVIIVPQRRLFE